MSAVKLSIVEVPTSVPANLVPVRQAAKLLGSIELD